MARGNVKATLGLLDIRHKAGPTGEHEGGISTR